MTCRLVDLMDYRIRRFLISAAVICIAALLFLWAMHWMGKGINRVNSHPVERSFQTVLTVAAKCLQTDRIVHGLGITTLRRSTSVGGGWFRSKRLGS